MSLIEIEEETALEKVVDRAGQKLLELWPAVQDGSAEVKHKDDGSVVTAADYAANEILVAGIREIFPDDVIISEELPTDPAARGASRVWIVDPLDGTSHYVAGKNDFSVLVGLSVDEVVEYGIMYFPARAEKGKARRGGGAFINGDHAKVSNSSTVRQRGVYLRNLPVHKVEKELQSLVYDQSMDSGMAQLCVSNGTLDGVIIQMTTHQEWDLAAAVVIVEESGGKVTDEKGNKLRFNRPEIEFEYLLASNGQVHDELYQFLPSH